jgi:hypothetical protein
MLVTGIKSKPVYAPLRADFSGRTHLMLGRDDGLQPLLRVIAELRAEDPGALARTRVLCTSSSLFDAAGVAEVRTYGDAQALLDDYRRLLDSASMGLRLYVAGPESFIGLAMQLALEFNLNQDEIRAEECGTRARRVRCVHCRETTEDVHTNIVRCVGCARWLLVRDHYSRRLAAYMGVMVDAEAPGELPPIQESFP